MNPPTTITESRVLPGTIGALILGFACVVVASDAPQSMRIAVTIASLAAASWSIYRCLQPRWVFRLDQDKLWFQDLSSKQISEVNLTTVSAAKVRKRTISGVGAEGGIGFQNELILETKNGPCTLKLPFLQKSPEEVLEIVQSRLPRCPAQTV